MPTQYGDNGTTDVDEFNRLANGGTYPPISEYLDEAGAANKWAGTTGLESTAVLNMMAGNTPQYMWKDKAGAANQLAGTTGLDVPAVLRFIAP